MRVKSQNLYPQKLAAQNRHLKHIVLWLSQRSKGSVITTALTTAMVYGSYTMAGSLWCGWPHQRLSRQSREKKEHNIAEAEEHNIANIAEAEEHNIAQAEALQVLERPYTMAGSLWCGWPHQRLSRQKKEHNIAEAEEHNIANIAEAEEHNIAQAEALQVLERPKAPPTSPGLACLL